MSKDILKVGFYSRHARYVMEQISFQVEVIYD